VVDFDESQLIELIIAAKIRPAVNKVSSSPCADVYIYTHRHLTHPRRVQIVYHPDNAAGAPVGLCDSLGITVLTYKIFTFVGALHVL
jgi:diketogulonate reductase-like aldo/keto reductase